MSHKRRSHRQLAADRAIEGFLYDPISGGFVDSSPRGKSASLGSRTLVPVKFPRDLDSRPVEDEIIELIRGAQARIQAFQDRWDQPQIEQFVNSHVGDPVSVISVAFSDDADSIRDYWVEERNSWPVIPSDTGSIALDYGVTKVPESYVVAPSGLVVAGFYGGVTAAGLDQVIADNGGMAVAANVGTGTVR